MEIKRITPEQTKELLDSNTGYIYLDVRTVPEFDAGHVPGAKNRDRGSKFWQRCEVHHRLPERRPVHKSCGASADGRVPQCPGYARRIWW